MRQILRGKLFSKEHKKSCFKGFFLQNSFFYAQFDKMTRLIAVLFVMLVFVNPLACFVLFRV